MGEVVYVQPKQRTLRYKRHDLTIKYMPDERKWYWEFSYTVTRTLHGFADTFTEAEQTAKRHIDTMVKK